MEKEAVGSGIRKVAMVRRSTWQARDAPQATQGQFSSLCFLNLWLRMVSTIVAKLRQSVGDLFKRNWLLGSLAEQRLNIRRTRYQALLRPLLMGLRNQKQNKNKLCIYAFKEKGQL